MIKRGATHENPTPWIHGVMQIFALFMFLGCLTSLLVPESKGARLEDLAGEDEDRYELQFRSRFYDAGNGAGGVRSPRSAFMGGLGMRERGGVGAGRGGLGRGGRERGYEMGATTRDVEKGKWWKLG
jgi:PHS family inorganic phosphate transporter-like MFS transporter